MENTLNLFQCLSQSSSNKYRRVSCNICHLGKVESSPVWKLVLNCPTYSQVEFILSIFYYVLDFLCFKNNRAARKVPNRG